MRRAIIGSGFFMFACGAAFGQAADGNLTFEVASVKLSTVPPAGPPNTDGGPGTRYPERYSAFTTLRGFLFRAFGLVDFQQQISGPAWIDSEKYAIEAKVPPGTTKEQFQVMLRNLLVERFKLVVHHDTKVLAVYDLVLAKNGPKFKESPANPDAVPAPPPTGVDRDGFPGLPPGRPGLAANYAMGPSGPVSRWRAQQQPISAFVGVLGLPTNAGRPVIDKTGLTGKYDFTLFYDVQIPGAPPAVANTPTLTIFDAIEQQLGLKLVDGKAPFDLVVVDHAEKTPTEN
jgi:uncharacterized protein (TIGR03435 family)